MIRIGSVGNKPWILQVDVEPKIWNIGSLAIVSLGVSYKYILSLALSEEIWNCTKLSLPVLRIEYGL